MSKVQTFVETAVAIANDNRHGYDQNDRDGNPNFDCSGLVYHCGNKAGYNVPTTGLHYTGTIIEHFSKAGWRVDAFDGNISDLEYGDIMLRDTHPDGHVAIYCGASKMVEASINELGLTTGGQSGDQTGHEIHVCAARTGASAGRPWTHILTAPKETTQPAKASTPAKQSSNDKMAKIYKLAKEIMELSK